LDDIAHRREGLHHWTYCSQGSKLKQTRCTILMDVRNSIDLNFTDEMQ